MYSCTRNLGFRRGLLHRRCTNRQGRRRSLRAKSRNLSFECTESGCRSDRRGCRIGGFRLRYSGSAPHCPKSQLVVGFCRQQLPYLHGEATSKLPPPIAQAYVPTLLVPPFALDPRFAVCSLPSHTGKASGQVALSPLALYAALTRLTGGTIKLIINFNSSVPETGQTAY